MRSYFFPLVFISCLAVASQGQVQAGRDAQALQILANVAGTSAAPSASADVQDFMGTGTITYYWAGKEVQGAVTIRGRGIDQFRLDANLPGGMRSWTVSHGKGALKEFDGTVTPISFHNAIALATLNLQHPHISAALHDPSIAVAYKGLKQIGSQQFQDVRIVRHVIPNTDSTIPAGRIGQIDVLIDPATFDVAGITDYTHPNDTFTVEVPHAVYFSDYRQLNGIKAPYSISEWINNQKIWTIQLTTLAFNSGLTDADFGF